MFLQNTECNRVLLTSKIKPKAFLRGSVSKITSVKSRYTTARTHAKVFSDPWDVSNSFLSLPDLYFL